MPPNADDDDDDDDDCGRWLRLVNRSSHTSSGFPDVQSAENSTRTRTESGAAANGKCIHIFIFK